MRLLTGRILFPFTRVRCAFFGDTVPLTVRHAPDGDKAIRSSLPRACSLCPAACEPFSHGLSGTRCTRTPPVHGGLDARRLLFLHEQHADDGQLYFGELQVFHATPLSLHPSGRGVRPREFVRSRTIVVLKGYRLPYQLIIKTSGEWTRGEPLCSGAALMHGL